MRGSQTRGGRSHIRAGVLSVALIVSALGVSAARHVPGGAWLAWCTLLPMFLVIRAWRPRAAFVGGGLWGISVCLGSLICDNNGSFLTASALGLVVAVPALYAGLGALLTRRIGFNPFVLGVGWMAVELAAEPVGASGGLLAGAESGTGSLHWIAQALGYVLVAFVVATANASLISVLSAVHLRIPPLHFRISLGDRGMSLSPQTFLCLPRFDLQASQPRAPPVTAYAFALPIAG